MKASGDVLDVITHERGVMLSFDGPDTGEVNRLSFVQ